MVWNEYLWNVYTLSMLSGQLTRKDAFADLWSLVSGAIALDPATFQALQNQPNSLPAALTIVFIAGFAQSLSQIVVLFVNQVRPLRFVLSLWISALFFVIGYVFWAISSWAILNTVFDGYLPFAAVVRTLGFCYAPLMLGIFVVIPYFGSAIFVLLSIWTLLAVVVGIDSITTLGRWEAFGCVALGWVVLQLLQKTVGQPIASLGQWITNWAAGEELITNRTRLSEELYAGLKAQRASPERFLGDADASSESVRVDDARADKARSGNVRSGNVRSGNVPLQPKK